MHRVEHLTDTQERILGCIRQAILDRGEAPTVAEIRAQLGLSAGGVHYQLVELETKGAIARDRYQRRGIRLT